MWKEVRAVVPCMPTSGVAASVRWERARLLDGLIEQSGLLAFSSVALQIFHHQILTRQLVVVGEMVDQLKVIHSVARVNGEKVPAIDMIDYRYSKNIYVNISFFRFHIFSWLLLFL